MVIWRLTDQGAQDPMGTGLTYRDSQGYLLNLSCEVRLRVE